MPSPTKDAIIAAFVEEAEGTLRLEMSSFLLILAHAWSYRLDLERDETLTIEGIIPIRVNLDLMLVKRGVKLSELSEAIDIMLPTLSILKTNKVRAIRFSTFEAICHDLGCQPAYLLEYVLENGEQ